MRVKQHKYTEEEKQFLKENADGISRKELQQKFNQHFKLELSIRQISSTMNRFNIKNNIDTTFKKEEEPWNKGTKGVMKPNTGTWNIGNVPPNRRPLGSERIDKLGYTLIKTEKSADGWKLKHRLIWEKANGIIPKNHTVVFADGDKGNFDLDNLLLVSRSELLFMNSRNLIYGDKELTKTGLQVAKIHTKIAELKKERR